MDRFAVPTSRKWPFYDEEQIQDVVDVLRSGEVNSWTGPSVSRFEKAYAEFLGVAHAIGLANGTVALELALYALDMKQDDEVIVAPRTFIASASCVAFMGGTPVFADVDKVSQGLTAQTIAQKITPRTRGIIVVHLGGWPCDMKAIMEVARQYGLWVVEDCAQAHGAEIDGRPVGSFGDVAAFSFCQDKIITTGGEGGLIAMNDTVMWKKAWSRKEHGKSYDAVFNKSHAPGFRWLHEELGTNWRMTSIQAVLGLHQLRKLPEWTAQRTNNAMILYNACKKLVALHTPLPPSNIKHAWYRFYVFVKPELLAEGWNRDRIMAEINAAGTNCMVGSCSEVYLEKVFQHNQAYRVTERLPNARELGETSLAFLVDPTLSEARMKQAADAICMVMKQATAENSSGHVHDRQPATSVS